MILMNELENDRRIIGVFLNFSKAFDTVGHKILLNKLNKNNLRYVMVIEKDKGNTSPCEILLSSKFNKFYNLLSDSQ